MAVPWMPRAAASRWVFDDDDDDQDDQDDDNEPGLIDIDDDLCAWTEKEKEMEKEKEIQAPSALMASMRCRPSYSPPTRPAALRGAGASGGSSTIQISLLPVRSEAKAIREPSGDQQG